MRKVTLIFENGINVQAMIKERHYKKIFYPNKKKRSWDKLLFWRNK